MFPNAPASAFCGGYLGVEFFFVTSGYFLMQHKRKSELQRNEQKDIFKNVWEYLSARWLRLFPMYLFSMVCLAALQIYLGEISLQQFLAGGLWEIFMIQAVGVPWLLNGHLWYVSALMLASGLIYYLLEKNEHIYIYICAPITFFLVMANIFRIIGHIDIGLDFHFLVCDGLWRAFAEIGLGCIIYRICEYLRQQVDFSKIEVKIVSTITGVILFIVVAMICFYKCRTVYDFTAVILIAILVMNIMLGSSFVDLALDNRLSDYLGKISYGVYVNQMLFLRIFLLNFSSRSFWPVTIAYVVSLTIFSMFSTYFLDAIKKHFHFLSRKTV